MLLIVGIKWTVDLKTEKLLWAIQGLIEIEDGKKTTLMLHCKTDLREMFSGPIKGEIILLCKAVLNTMVSCFMKQIYDDLGIIFPVI